MPNVVQQYNFNNNEYYNRCGRLHLVFVTDLYLIFELIMLTAHAEQEIELFIWAGLFSMGWNYFLLAGINYIGLDYLIH